VNKPKVLILDIETSPIEARVWSLYDQNIAVNQITKDWEIMSWAAKWLGGKTVYQEDQGEYTERGLVLGLWIFLDDADIVVTQNGKKFDIPKINAKFLQYGLKPVKPFQHIDTRQLAKKHFGFTSNSLEYMTSKFNTKYKKLSHKKFPGQELWNECLKGNKTAWKEMAKYNKHDVLATEELYKKLAPFGSGVNFSVFHDPSDSVCACGNKTFRKDGFVYTAAGKYQRWDCTKCGAYLKEKKNLFKGKFRKVS